VLLHFFVAVIEYQVIYLRVDFVWTWRTLVSKQGHCTLCTSPLMEGYILAILLIYNGSLYWFLVSSLPTDDIQRSQHWLILWQRFRFNHLLFRAMQHPSVWVADIFDFIWGFSLCMTGFCFAFRGSYFFRWVLLFFGKI
jgi:hypothetical protein